jgi:hypothetical protein
MCGYGTRIFENFVNVLLNGRREIQREGKLNMSNYVSERKRIPWRGMIAVFRTERYKMPIEGTMKSYDYFLPQLAI